MCLACQTLTHSLTPADIRKISMFHGVLLAHFVDLSGVWYEDLLSDVLLSHIDDEAVRTELSQYPELVHILALGGMCAFALIARSIANAEEDVNKRTEEDLAEVRSALAN